MGVKSKIQIEIRKATSTNHDLNKKIMNFKRSWDEVDRMINGAYKKKNKK